MYEGEIVADVNPKEITVEELGLYMAGAKRSVKNENKWKNIWRGDGIVNFSSSILAIVCVDYYLDLLFCCPAIRKGILWIYDDPSGRIYRRNPGIGQMFIWQPRSL